MTETEVSDRRGSKKLMKKVVLFSLSTMLFALSSSAEAQQPGRVPRIGMLVSGSVATHGHQVDAFRQGLRDLGYVEGKNVIIN